MIRVTELSIETGNPTGYAAVYSSFEGPLYTARLKDGRACLGPTGRVVYPHGPGSALVWVMTNEKER